MTTAVCLDVEPGGAGRAEGAIGIAEIGDEGPGVAFQVRFPSPFARGGDGRGFAEVWLWLEAFIAGRPLVAYVAQYDRRQLGRLLAAAGAPPPGLTMRCAYQAACKALGRPAPSAQEWAVQLWSAAEVERRRRVFEDGLVPPGGKVVLHSAEDDARVCADVVQWVRAEQRVDLGDLLAGMTARTVG